MPPKIEVYAVDEASGQRSFRFGDHGCSNRQINEKYLFTPLGDFLISVCRCPPPPQGDLKVKLCVALVVVFSGGYPVFE